MVSKTTRVLIGLSLTFVIAPILSATAWGRAETVSGPVEAEVVRVIDGDTVEVRAKIWLDQWIKVSVRLPDIDTPELRTRCPSEKSSATAAKAVTERWLADSPRPGHVFLTDIRSGKYAGRVLGQITRPDGTRLSAALIASGLARPYDGGRRFDWCR